MHVCTDTCFKVRLSEAEGRVATATAAAEEVREALALRSREPQVVEAPTRASTAARVAEAHAHARACVLARARVCGSGGGDSMPHTFFQLLPDAPAVFPSGPIMQACGLLSCWYAQQKSPV